MLGTYNTLASFLNQGFINVTGEDRVENGPGFIPWYATLEGSFSLSGFRMTNLGRKLTHNLVSEWSFS